jgi:hypothetical protein
MNGNASTSNLQHRLNRALTADPKKSAALAVLFIVLLVVVVKMTVGQAKAHPASAGAAMVGNAPGSLQLKAAHPGTSWQKSTSPSEALQKWASAPPPSVSRNLFSVRIDYFPTEGSRTTQSGAIDEGFWSRLGKSMALQADQRDKQENLKANFKAQAEQLRLESTMTGGPQPKAMVNGELVGEGSVVAGFRVLKIEARRITVEREGIQLEIQTK